MDTFNKRALFYNYDKFSFFAIAEYNLFNDLNHM